MSTIPANHQSVLRLVRDEIADRHAARSTQSNNLTITPNPLDDENQRIKQRIIEESRKAALNPQLNPADPRWTLATQTQKELVGCAINPTKRSNLLRLATNIGLRQFDANLIIAIVQDQARQSSKINNHQNNQTQLANRLRIVPISPTSTTQKTSTIPTAPIPQNQFTQKYITKIKQQPAKKYRNLYLTITATILLTTTILTLLINWLLTPT